MTILYLFILKSHENDHSIIPWNKVVKLCKNKTIHRIINFPGNKDEQQKRIQELASQLQAAQAESREIKESLSRKLAAYEAEIASLHQNTSGDIQKLLAEIDKAHNEMRAVANERDKMREQLEMLIQELEKSQVDAKGLIHCLDLKG